MSEYNKPYTPISANQAYSKTESRESDFGNIRARLDTLVSNFADIATRLENATDSLFGPTPNAANTLAGPAPVPNGYVDSFQYKLTQIDDLRCSIVNSMERLERAV